MKLSFGSLSGRRRAGIHLHSRTHTKAVEERNGRRRKHCGRWLLAKAEQAHGILLTAEGHKVLKPHSGNNPPLGDKKDFSIFPSISTAVVLKPYGQKLTFVNTVECFLVLWEMKTQECFPAPQKSNSHTEQPASEALLLALTS